MFIFMYSNVALATEGEYTDTSLNNDAKREEFTVAPSPKNRPVTVPVEEFEKHGQQLYFTSTPNNSSTCIESHSFREFLWMLAKCVVVSI